MCTRTCIQGRTSSTSPELVTRRPASTPDRTASTIHFRSPIRRRRPAPDQMSSHGLILLLALAQFASSASGELRLTVVDPSGLPVHSIVELVSEANEVHETLETDAQGSLTAKR